MSKLVEAFGPDVDASKSQVLYVCVEHDIERQGPEGDGTKQCNIVVHRLHACRALAEWECCGYVPDRGHSGPQNS